MNFTTANVKFVHGRPPHPMTNPDVDKVNPHPLEAAVNIRMAKVMFGCDPKFFLPKIY